MAILKGSEPIKDIAKGSGSLSGVYLGESLVWPSGWQPGANTIAYYPLNGDANDYSGNGYHGIWTNGAHYETISGTKQAASFSRSFAFSYINTSCLIIPKTVSFWRRKTELTLINEDWQQIIGQNQLDEGARQFRCSSFSSYYPNALQQFVLQTASNNYEICTGYQNRPYGTTWHHICLVVSGSTTLLYIDNELKHTFNYALGTARDGLRIGGRGNSSSYRSSCAMSDVILESISRDDNTRSNYYNQTKSNYGL